MNVWPFLMSNKLYCIYHLLENLISIPKFKQKSKSSVIITDKVMAILLKHICEKNDILISSGHLKKEIKRMNEVSFIESMSVPNFIKIQKGQVFLLNWYGMTHTVCGFISFQANYYQWWCTTFRSYRIMPILWSPV